MIDVVFQLVIFFMISSTLITRTGIDLDLPEATSAREGVTSSVVLIVVSEQEMYLGDVRLTLAELGPTLAATEQDVAGRAISIEADRTIDYGVIIAVLDALRSNGIRGANLVARERFEGAP